MKRVAEPELMDEPHQALAYARADFAAPHNRFVELFGEAFAGEALAAAEVVDLGCGPADVTVRFAKAYPHCRITGVDAGPNMLALAREAIAAAGLADRIGLQLRRLPNDALPSHRYDAVISNSLLHHLADPLVLWRAIRRLGARNAAVFVMDLLRPANVAEWDGLVKRYAGDEPEILQQDFRNSLCAGYRADEVAAQMKAVGLSGLSVRVVSDRHWIACGRLVPGNSA